MTEEARELIQRLRKISKARIVLPFEDVALTCYNEAPVDGVEIKRAVFVDTETTGKNVDKDRVIELGLVLFEFSVDGRIFSILDHVSMFQDPGIPIPPEATEVHGITDAMVRGKEFNMGRVDSILNQASVVIAHNAKFDRPLLEREVPAFARKAWACSMSEIDWASEGVESAKQEYIAYRLGFFYSGHRAEDDCLAGVHILAQTLPESGQPALKVMLDNARKEKQRVWATNSPFDKKDILSDKRGYTWHDGKLGHSKSWYRDVDRSEVAAEIAYLQEEIYGFPAEVDISTVNAFNRHSRRI